MLQPKFGVTFGSLEKNKPFVFDLNKNLRVLRPLICGKFVTKIAEKESNKINISVLHNR